MPLQLPPPPPPPSGSVLALLAALSNHDPTNRDTHALALRARDDALSGSPAGYTDLCANLSRALACHDPRTVPREDLRRFHDSDPAMFARCAGWAVADPADGADEASGGMAHWNALRQLAGLLLKNALVSPPLPRDVPTDRLGRVLPGHARRMALDGPGAAAEIQRALYTCLASSEVGIRNAASSCISSCCVVADGHPETMAAFSVSNWADLVPFLLQCVQFGAGGGGGGGAEAPGDGRVEEQAAIGSLQTLRKLLEDIPHRLINESPGTSFHDLVPALLACLTSRTEPIRREALSCLNCLVEPMPGSLASNVDGYLAGLSGLAGDPSPRIRCLVCRGIVTLLGDRPEYLQPHVGPVSEFMLKSTADADPDVALEACEFWLTFASLGDEEEVMYMMETVLGLLPRLIPRLLENMVYPPERIEELLESNRQDERDGAERAQDLRPVFHKSKMKGGDDDSDDESDDDDEFDDDNQWTLRKCSAASLDTLAGMYGGGEHVLPHLLPPLGQCLESPDQWRREAAILALGAVSEGCGPHLAEHMPRLHPFLLGQLTAPDSLPQVRCIAAWTLGRYSSWAVGQVGAPGGDPALVARVVEAFAGRMGDANRRVQVAVTSSLGVFADAARELLVPYLGGLYKVIVHALDTYGTRSRLVLLDAMGVIAECVGQAVGRDGLPAMYVPRMLRMWNDLATADPFDRSLLPLMECLGSHAVYIGLNFQPWALETFEMAMSTIEACMIMIAHDEDDLDDVDDEMTDPIICAIDLTDGLVEGLGPNFASLVESSPRFGPTFPSTVRGAAIHAVPGVRMSAYALVGDLARHAPALIQDVLPELLKGAIESMTPMHPSLCNNAAWAIGEICVRCGSDPAPLRPYAPGILSAVVPLLVGNAVDVDGNEVRVHGLAENGAITMGRLACVDPGFVAQDLPRFLVGWCDSMSKISDHVERNDAFRGFVAALRANPGSISGGSAGHHTAGDALGALLFAIVSWHLEGAADDALGGAYSFAPFPSQHGELLDSLRGLLRDLKSSLGEDWAEVERGMPPNVKRLMAEQYGLQVS
mmetsp:Transcript_24631/g.56219  ORF Transcript_24631/g.56219 Transcript_24631/m.56219 type:complete len:1050 (+) Transcript_24631:166-3315(+)